MRIKLAEYDDVSNNKFFIKRASNNREILKGLDHNLGEFTTIDIVEDDLKKFLGYSSNSPIDSIVI
ncbi:hypothetical protein [Francisella sp. 19X1-34]|uniref:hypothetical protein n=1 Tax=Francisella sp. 19X1-34 TaxID=3087177 RepID=UPI002E30DDA4|nr:hypothetical protein [Francisella sp. 19X1-34]MED7788556.1 hypothetical protein [Francisella sp. 19X1-34]